MLVKAKWNVKDANGWHNGGDVFQTEDDLGNAVEVLDVPKATVKASKIAEAVAEAEKTEPVKEPAKPRSTSRRKVSK